MNPKRLISPNPTLAPRSPLPNPTHSGPGVVLFFRASRVPRQRGGLICGDASITSMKSRAPIPRFVFPFVTCEPVMTIAQLPKRGGP